MTQFTVWTMIIQTAIIAFQQWRLGSFKNKNKALEEKVNNLNKELTYVRKSKKIRQNNAVISDSDIDDRLHKQGSLRG